MENFGYITLNISLIIYFIHFLPQTIHNQFKHKTFEISLWTHSLMIVANSLDLIYAIGFNMQWQYILVDIILLSF
ncbi:PQ-loop domain-containing transporter, partial [Francisella hispaniensis]